MNVKRDGQKLVGDRHPLARFAGIFKDDPVFDEIVANIEAASERQRQEAIREAEAWERRQRVAAHSKRGRRTRAA